MTANIASFGMYDHAGQQAANDLLWATLRTTLARHGIDAPDQLERGRSPESVWRDPSLLLAQACGYPLVTDPDLDLRVVGVPTYSVPDCAPGVHFSHIIARRDDHRRYITDFRGARAAINAGNSNTGYNLFRSAIARWAKGEQMFEAVVETGSHRASAEAIRTDEADIAAIDVVTWAALARFEPDLVSELRIVERTRASPTLPFVTARGTSRETLAALRSALASVARDPALASARKALFLEGIAPASIHRFVALRRFEREAAEAGYPHLH